METYMDRHDIIGANAANALAFNQVHPSTGGASSG
jgi:hypothetical protein